MHNPTPFYGLVKPEPTDTMSSFDTQINPNWDKLTDAVSPNSGTTLPQSGTYNIGDRFYKSDTQSIYILVLKDANWGWHWRPVQDAISPWLTIPSTALNDAAWTLNPVAANPFAIALDNRGRCHWRGVIGTITGNFTRNTSPQVLKPVPTGIRIRESGVFMCGHETLTVSTSTTSLQGYQGARIFLPEGEGIPCSVRGFGGTADFNRIHLNFNYAVGTAHFTSP